MEDLRLVLITGLSGAGKSTVLRAVEDIGFYCLDNLPVPLLPGLLDLCSRGDLHARKVAVVMDLREPAFATGYESVLRQMRNEKLAFEMIYLEAYESVTGWA